MLQQSFYKYVFGFSDISHISMRELNMNQLDDNDIILLTTLFTKGDIKDVVFLLA
jgi:hypothetical protein